MKKIIVRFVLCAVALVVVVTIALGYPFYQQMVPPSGPTPTYADIPYAPATPADSVGHLLDLYLPESDIPAPIVIWTGGSGWLSDNSKASAAWLAPELNEAGFALAGVSIRSSSQVSFPGQLHDIKAAIRWLRANSENYGIDGNRIAVMGDSSGGWTAAMAGVTSDVPMLEGDVGTTGVSSAVQAVVALYPAVRFTEMDKNSIEPCTSGTGLLGILTGKIPCYDDDDSPVSRLIDCPIQSCIEEALAADPSQYVSEQDPPIMILHGQADRGVPYSQSELFYSSLSSACHDVVFISLPEAGHGPAWDFLTDQAVSEGATIRSTSRGGCIRTEPNNYKLGINTIVGFLKRTLTLETF